MYGSWNKTARTTYEMRRCCSHSLRGEFHTFRSRTKMRIVTRYFSANLVVFVSFGFCIAMPDAIVQHTTNWNLYIWMWMCINALWKEHFQIIEKKKGFFHFAFVIAARRQNHRAFILLHARCSPHTVCMIGFEYKNTSKNLIQSPEKIEKAWQQILHGTRHCSQSWKSLLALKNTVWRFSTAL